MKGQGRGDGLEPVDEDDTNSLSTLNATVWKTEVNWSFI